jgi:hypothetical protein
MLFGMEPARDEPDDWWWLIWCCEGCARRDHPDLAGVEAFDGLEALARRVGWDASEMMGYLLRCEACERVIG